MKPRKAAAAAMAVILAYAAGAVTMRLPVLRADGNAPLEPSIQNEVDHAIEMAQKAAAAFAKKHEGKEETREQLALRLVTSQKSDGSWAGDDETTTLAYLQLLQSL